MLFVPLPQGDPEHIHQSKLHMEEKPLDCEVQNQTLGGNGKIQN